MLKNFLSLFPVRGENRERLEAALGECEVVYSSHAGVTEDEIRRAEVILGNPEISQLEAAESLKWLHLCSAGTDGYMDIARGGVLLTNGTGAYDAVLPEHMLALLFALNAHICDYREQQRARQWSRLGWSDYISGSTCLMLGAGSIGLGFLKRMKALGAYTVGVRRSGSTKPDYVDEMHTMADIDALLPRADVVAMALPGTAETTNILDARRFSLMKDGAKLINCGRGNSVEPSALNDALRSGKLAGAGLDVTYIEPLPQDSPLWDAPNLIITPHIAGGWNIANDSYSPFMEKAVFEVFWGNLQDYLEGRPLRNIVDLNTGYRKTQG